MERTARTLVAGEVLTQREDVPLDQFSACIRIEATGAARTSLEDDALVAAVRERCAEIEREAFAATPEFAGRNLDEIKARIEQPFRQLILRTVADVRTGRLPGRLAPDPLEPRA